LRVLVGCEYSGRVRDAFLARGHDAVSCDLLPSDVPGPHYQGDVRDILDDGWDLGIFFPDCTYLTHSAEWCYKDDPGKKMRPGVLYGAERRQAREDALAFVRLLLDARIPKIALENPVGAISTRIRPASQYVQPYQFGDDASKKTGLWLKNLPPLVPTKMIPPRYVCCGEVLDLDGVGLYGCPNCCGDNKPLPRWGNQTNGGQNKHGPSDDRWKIRSYTWPGLADAMGEQWGRVRTASGALSG
jgi:hypothetical protein